MRYDFAKILGLRSQSKEGFSWTRPARKPDEEHCICSELYSDAYTCITGKALWNLVGQEVTPAFLSHTSTLENVRKAGGGFPEGAPLASLTGQPTSHSSRLTYHKAMEYPMHIAGQPVRNDDPRPVKLPYDGSEVGIIFQATKEQVDAAIAAAVAAAPVMREMTLDERSTILRKAYHRLLERKRRNGARRVLGNAASRSKRRGSKWSARPTTLLFSSEEAHRLHGEVVPMDASPRGKGHWAMTVREPLGVIAAITPFNFPLNLAMHKIGPALAGGNTVVAQAGVEHADIGAS